MRPVNLLPPKHRPHQPTGSKSGSSYVVLGILAVLLVAAVTYVLESNKITQAKSDIASAERKTAEAKDRAQQLGPFANFAQIKEQRVASVRQLAEGRFDWERTVRELAHVLPEGVWLRDFDASVTGDDGAGGATTPPSGTSGAAAVPAGPTLKLHGCAYGQRQVAVLLIRLREMQGVKDVQLSDSTRGEDEDDSGSAADSQQPVDGCGEHDERANYEFNVAVEFDQALAAAAASAPGAGKTPVRLGGGK